MPISLITAKSQGGAPAFSATGSVGTTIATVTFTKIQCNTEVFDTNLNYDNATNYRFTPTVAGYYQITGAIGLTVSASNLLVTIYKNGSEFARGNFSAGANSIVTSLIYFNGSTDYVELYAYQSSGSTQNIAGNAFLTYFQGSFVRSA